MKPPSRGARGLAVQILTGVLSDGKPLPQLLDEPRVPAEDRAWLTEICSGVLRWKGRLDLAIDSVALRKKPSGWLRKILLVGAYQLIVQERVAPAIVVSETVSEVKKREGEAPARFANALLRKIADTAKAWRELALRGDADQSEQAAWASLPEWFWKRIADQQGLDWAARFAESSLERPKIWLRVAGQSEPEEAARELSGRALGEREGFAEGRFFVQDVSSQLLVREIAAFVREKRGEHPSVLDLCSAPGGKSVGLSWNGFQVVATDGDSARLARVRENAKRLRGEAERTGGNLRVVELAEVAGLEPQDLVWVDAPCTGSGIVRRHPDVRWLRREKDLESLAELQLRLIREGWEKVRDGGYLAYSVCSVFREEGPEVVRAAGLSDAVMKSWLLCPHELPHGDGFWAALIRK